MTEPRETARLDWARHALADSGALQDLYAVANGLSATTYDLGDAMAAVGINAVL